MNLTAYLFFCYLFCYQVTGTPNRQIACADYSKTLATYAIGENSAHNAKKYIKKAYVLYKETQEYYAKIENYEKAREFYLEQQKMECIIRKSNDAGSTEDWQEINDMLHNKECK